MIFTLVSIVSYHEPSCLNCNVILITLDTVRADHVGLYGYYRNTTPNIDAFASNSIVYLHAVSPIPHTLSAHTSILTSEFARSHAVISNYYKVNKSLITIQKVLKENGYTAGAVVSGGALSKETGINDGFDFYDDNFTERRNATEVDNIALRWLDKNKNGKFFFWIHYFDSHTPYFAPNPYDSMFDNNTDPVAITVNDGGVSKKIALWYHNTSRAGMVIDWIVNWNLSSNFPEGDFQNISAVKTTLNLSDTEFSKFMVFFNHNIALYDGSIAYDDFNLGKILDFLKENKMMNNTIIVIAGDHGEGFDHGEFFSHGKMFEQDLHVPLIIYYPNANPKKIGATVSLIDIAPTILKLLNIPVPKEMVGKNLLSVNDNCDCYAFSESPFFESPSIESSEWKLLSYRLFNIKNDPNEQDNFFEKRPDIVLLLKNKVDEIIKNIPVGVPYFQNERFKNFLRTIGYIY